MKLGSQGYLCDNLSSNSNSRPRGPQTRDNFYRRAVHHSEAISNGPSGAPLQTSLASVPVDAEGSVDQSAVDGQVVV